MLLNVIKCSQLSPRISENEKKTIENDNLEEKLARVMLELEAITEKKREIQNENETLELKCEQMKTSFDKTIQKDQDTHSYDILAELEHIKSEKERIMREDNTLELSNSKLWEAAGRIKHETQRVAAISNQLEQDSKEMDEIYKRINDERAKLIDKDKLINARHSAIIESLQTICQQRMTLQLQINDSSSHNSNDESENIKDLELAVLQKDIEDQFEDWKMEKENILKENSDLDKILDSLLAKNDILKQRNNEIFEKKISLSQESDAISKDFERNQSSKESLIKQFKNEEEKIERIMKESNEYSSSNSTDSDIKQFLEDFAEVKARREMLSIQENKYNEEIMQIKENYENLLNLCQGNNLEPENKDNVDIESLIRKKEMLLEEDKELACKFEEYEKVIDELNSTRDKLKKEIEDLEWETCFQENL